MHRHFIRILTLHLTTLLILVGLSALCFATPPAWGDLEPGPHAVGFKTIEQYDHSRSFSPKRDYFGDAIPGETARPIQVCIWYPAVAAEDGDAEEESADARVHEST